MLMGRGVTKKFGGLVALKDIDFTIKEKEIVALIGPNGAGKTTLFNVINGIFPPESGEIIFDGKNITGLKPFEICRLGIGRTFQIVRPFSNMTVLDNVAVAACYKRGEIISLKKAREEAQRYVEFVKLLDKANRLAGSLNLPDKRKLEIARALSTDPKIILLDEVISGLNPTETLETVMMIQKIRDELGITIFWIEHVMRAVMTTAERVIVLHHGQKIADESPKEVSNDEKVIEAYLGEKYML